MNDLPASSIAKELLAAAKADGPSAAARAKMWTGVSGAVGGTASATGLASAGSLLSGGTSASKVLSIGSLFGGTLTVGLAAALLRVGPSLLSPTPTVGVVSGSPAAGHAAMTITRESPAPIAVPAAEALAAGQPAAPAPVIVNFNPAAGTVAPSLPAPAGHAAKGKLHAGKRAKGGGAGHDDVVDVDALGREASLVSQARAALDHGDPRAALQAVRTARALPSHQLDPEELAVEEQALRALGRSDEANGIEVQLRLQYPESDLAR